MYFFCILLLKTNVVEIYPSIWPLTFFFKQNALGLQDLGSLYHSPVKDTNGSIVLVTVTSVRDVKCVSTAHCRWSLYSKVMKRVSTNDVFAAPEMLLQNAQVRMMSSQTLLYVKKTFTICVHSCAQESRNKHCIKLNANGWMQCVLCRTCVTTPRRRGRRCHVVCTWATSNSAARWRTSTSWFPRQRQTRCRTLRYATTLTFRSKCFSYPYSLTLPLSATCKRYKEHQWALQKIVLWFLVQMCEMEFYVVFIDHLQDGVFCKKACVSFQERVALDSSAVSWGGRERSHRRTERLPRSAAHVMQANSRETWCVDSTKHINKCRLHHFTPLIFKN